MKKGNGKVTVDALLTIYKDEAGNVRCSLKPGLGMTEAMALLGTFRDQYTYMIIEQKIAGKSEKPEPSRIVKPF